MKKTKKIIFLSAGGVLLAIGILICSKLVISKINEKPVYYAVRKENYENIIEISGTVQAAEEQTLQALSDGTVMGVYVNEGDSVKKGDVIIQLDDTDQQYNLAKQDYNIAATKITGSAREIKLMETERLALVQKVADRKVVATFDGVIAELDVSVGDSLEAKDSVGTLVNVDYLIAEVEIAETDVSKLEVGQKVEFTFSAYKDKAVYGTVIGWPAIGEITSRGATVVNAKIKIENYPKEILPNYSFTGKIQISEPEEYLVVERYAIGYEDKKPYVVKKESGKKVFVNAVPFGKTSVKILGGEIKEGDLLEELTKPKKSGSSKNDSKNNQPMGNMPGGFGPPRM
ncbi:MAG: efflux RND transporter periplasmic adaptor subunit [Treponema sp.]